MTKTSFLQQGKWHIWRDGGIGLDSEWRPTNSWRGTRRLNDTVVYAISIYGKVRIQGFGLQARRWHSDICFNDLRFRVPSSHPSCKSVNDAVLQADRFLSEEIFLEACRWFTSYRHVECVVKEISNEGALSYIPYFSSFGRTRWMGPNEGQRLFSYGTYYVTRRQHIKNTVSGWTQIRLGAWGVGGMHTDRQFSHWL